MTKRSIKSLFSLLCLLTFLGCTPASAPTTSELRRAAALAPVPSPTIQIGVYMAPASSFQKWKDRGINTIVTDKSKPDSPPETQASRTAYFKAASDLGMQLIIGSDPMGAANDLPRPGLLAWCQPDEPESWSKVVKNPDGSFNWSATTNRYRLDYANLKNIAPNVPVYGNFAGGPLLSARETSTDPRNITLPTYRDFAKGADWLASDFYICPQGRPPEQLANYGKQQDCLQSIGPGKPTYAVVECCDQGLPNGRAPTASEVRAAIWIAMIHGAQGIVYFPLKVQGGFQWDNTPTGVAAAMPVMAAELQANADFIRNGQRTKGTGESAMWTLPNGSTLKVSAVFASGEWTVNVVRNIVVIDPEKEALMKENAALKARQKRIDDWHGAYPN
jgi:hypothetical protein